MSRFSLNKERYMDALRTVEKILSVDAMRTTNEDVRESLDLHAHSIISIRQVFEENFDEICVVVDQKEQLEDLNKNYEWCNKNLSSRIEQAERHIDEVNAFYKAADTEMLNSAMALFKQIIKMVDAWGAVSLEKMEKIKNAQKLRDCAISQVEEN